MSAAGAQAIIAYTSGAPVLRAGRIGLHVEVQKPDETEHAELVDFLVGDSQLPLDSGAHAALVSETAGSSRADLRMLWQSLRMQAGKRVAPLELHESDIREAIALSRRA